MSTDCILISFTEFLFLCSLLLQICCVRFLFSHTWCTHIHKTHVTNKWDRLIDWLCTVYCIFLACTNLLMSLNVVSIAGCSVSVKLEHFLWILWQFFPSWPSRAARIYLKNRNISTLSDVGFRNSFNSLKLKKSMILHYLDCLRKYVKYHFYKNNEKKHWLKCCVLCIANDHFTINIHFIPQIAWKSRWHFRVFFRQKITVVHKSVKRWYWYTFAFFHTSHRCHLHRNRRTKSYKSSFRETPKTIKFHTHQSMLQRHVFGEIEW